MSMSLTLNNRLTPDTTARAVRHIIMMVFQLTKYFHDASPNTKNTILKHLCDSYEYECKLKNKMIPVEQYILETGKSIGWDWVLPDK
jgi:hypothetical protein